MSVWVYAANVQIDAWKGQKKTSEPLELESQAASCELCDKSTGNPTGLATSALKFWDIASSLMSNLKNFSSQIKRETGGTAILYSTQ